MHPSFPPNPQLLLDIPTAKGAGLQISQFSCPERTAMKNYAQCLHSEARVTPWDFSSTCPLSPSSIPGSVSPGSIFEWVSITWPFVLRASVREPTTRNQNTWPKHLWPAPLRALRSIYSLILLCIFISGCTDTSIFNEGGVPRLQQGYYKTHTMHSSQHLPEVQMEPKS